MKQDEQQTQWISTNTVVIGGGQAGLAMSRCLLERSVGHVLLERGHVGERWRSSYWDSLRLLTPKWQSRLPGGYRYEGGDESEFFTTAEYIQYLEEYAKSFQAPVRTNTNVISVEEIYDSEGENRYKITTERGPHWFALNVVIATGYCDIPKIPNLNTGNLDPSVLQLTTAEYKNPAQILYESAPVKDGSTILVVGAGASGLQIAQELAVAAQNHSSDVNIVISTGRHCRWPRSHRGKDILWWMDQMGAFRAPSSQQDEASNPGPQLMGCTSHADISLYSLKTQHQVEIVGKVKKIEFGQVHFDNEMLGSYLKEADDKCVTVIKVIDDFIAERGLNSNNTPGTVDHSSSYDLLCPRLPYQASESAPSILDSTTGSLICVVWATGFNRSYPFLSKSLAEELWDPARNIIRNDGGVTSKPGFYVLGYRWMRRKHSNFVDGVGTDASDIANHLDGSSRARG